MGLLRGGEIKGEPDGCPGKSLRPVIGATGEAAESVKMTGETCLFPVEPAGRSREEGFFFFFFKNIIPSVYRDGQK